MRAYFYDAMLIGSLLIMTLGIVGIWTMPDIYTKLHAASKSVFLGVVVIALSATAVGEREIVYRVIMLAILVTLTTPIASHVIGRAAFLMGEPMKTPGAVDETGLLTSNKPPVWVRESDRDQPSTDQEPT